MAAWVVPAISAVGAIASAFGGSGDSGSGGGTHKPKILPKTESGESEQSTQIQYDQASLDAMSELADQIGEFADFNENFIRDEYMPMQQQFVQANTQMIPQMESVVGDSLESMTKDLVTSNVMGDMLKARVAGDNDPNSFTNKTFKAFQTEIENLPTESERVGQALASVEHQFKGAGKNLAADFASRGQSISQASARDLAMKKATAKAGAAGLAKESARAERVNMLEKGVAVGQGKRAREEQIAGAATQGLLGLGQVSQAGLGAKAGLFDTDRPDPTGIRGQEMGLTGQLGVLHRGTETQQNQLAHTQKGIKSRPEIQEDGSIKIGSKILQSEEYEALKKKYNNMEDMIADLESGGGRFGADSRGGQGNERGQSRTNNVDTRTMTSRERGIGRGMMDAATGGLFGGISDAVGGMFGGGNEGGSDSNGGKGAEGGDR